MDIIDNHICRFCLRRTDEDGMGSTYDWNACENAAEIQYDETGKYLCKIGETGNDREFRRNGRLVFKTEDNGGGYNVLKCRDFRLDHQKYMRSDLWRGKRRDRLYIDGYKCRLCGSAMNLQVHHITYENVPDEGMDDLLTVCRTCHERLHRTDIQRKNFKRSHS